MKHPRESLLVLVVLLLGLAGCDNTSIAFCSGSDQFCENFFLKVADDVDQEEAEEPAPDETVQPTDASLQAASKVARLTPRPVANALAYDGMGTLMAEQPELVGLWLIDASLGRLLESNDNVATTFYLDQNRAWLFAPGGWSGAQVLSNSQVLTAGLNLFAAFAQALDPASAEAARALADAFRADGDVPDAFAASSTDQAAQIVLRAAEAPGNCCSNAELAASAVLLCEAGASDLALPAGRSERACAYAQRELRALLDLAPG